MSGPVVITGLACHFDPETRNLATGGKATRYAFSKCLIDFPRPEGGKKYICEIRRLRPGKGRPGAWRKAALPDEPHPALSIRQKAADYEGASYEIRARRKAARKWTLARVDFPPGGERRVQVRALGSGVPAG